MSGYVLDGIETAMEEGILFITCPCGHREARYESSHEWVNQLAALRWHYDHCEQAKVRKATVKRETIRAQDATSEEESTRAAHQGGDGG